MRETEKVRKIVREKQRVRNGHGHNPCMHIDPHYPMFAGFGSVTVIFIILKNEKKKRVCKRL